MRALENFSLEGRTAVITGGAGLLGRKHAETVLESGGRAVLVDISEKMLDKAVVQLKHSYPGCEVMGAATDITNKDEIKALRSKLLERYSYIDILINNAANNPKVEGNAENMKKQRFEDFPISLWEDDIRVGLTGACICTQIFGAAMAGQKKGGVILNISSDLGIIAPDQRIYEKEGLAENEQMVKPVTYSVVKHGLIGLTKYTATYWAKNRVRANVLCPAGVYNGQDEEFVRKLTGLIPIGRMADKNEYKSTVLYMISDASSYMNGSIVVVDGGRSCW